MPEIWEFPHHTNSIHSIYIEEYEVYSALISLDINKATGIDGVGPKILKHCAISLFQPLHHLFNLTLTKSVIPTEWKVHQIVATCLNLVTDHWLKIIGQSHSYVMFLKFLNIAIINDKIVSYIFYLT